jgi:hypothetical protein
VNEPAWTARSALLRGLGIVYAVAFFSLAREAAGLFGERGLLPAVTFLSAERELLGARAALHVPTLFWLDASNTTLAIVAYAGFALGLAVAAGCESAAVLGVLWVFYLSLVNVGQAFVGYSSDLLLLEVGFLAILTNPALPLKARVAPPAFTLWLLRWLAFRVLFGAGMAKLRSDPCWAALTCLPDYLETQPAPTSLAYHLHALPLPFQRVGSFVVLFSELIVPFGFFGPKLVRKIAGACTIVVRLLVLMAANAGVAGILVIVLAAAACFDDAAFERLGVRFPAPAGSLPELGRTKRLVVGAAGALLVLLSVLQFRELWSPAPYQSMSIEPFHLVNVYGAIEPVERERTEVVFEGTRDDAGAGEAHWSEYQLPCKPSDPARAPCRPSVYLHRLDRRLWEAALGDFRREAWVIRIVDDLLRENPAVTELFTVDPFAGNPPRFVRAVRYRYRFSRKDEVPYWHREPAGEYIRPFSLEDPALYEYLFRKGWIRQMVR